MCGGGAIGAIAESASCRDPPPVRAADRSFGAIKHKIGEMVVRTYAIEPAYRTAGLDAHRHAATPTTDPPRSPPEEYAVECRSPGRWQRSADFVLDENVQIHGGNGYVHDYPAERHLRDARQPDSKGPTRSTGCLPGMPIRRALKAISR
jgi:alkylation response protein AidB-like acyl-CoA dehydrogenase